METPLRILLVAASAADAEPLLDELGRAGCEVSPEIVSAVAETEKAVARGGFDLVVVLSEVRGCDTRRTVEIASATFDGPVLAVCEPAQEHALLSAGATGCVAKGLAGLAVRVARESGECRLRAERRRARLALQDSEFRFRMLAEHATEAILATDGEGSIVFANRTAGRVFGHPVTALIGRSINRVIPEMPDARGRRPGPGRDPSVCETAGVHASGREIPLEVSVVGVRRDGRRLFLIVARDVSEQKRTEDALRASQARKSAMIEAALDAIVTIDAEGRILEFNSSAERIFGYSRTYAVGRPMAELIVPPSQRERHWKGMARYLATGEGTILGRSFEMTAMRSDGSEFPVALTVTRLPSEGPPVFTGFIQDVSDRKRAESALRESEERFRVAAQISSDLVYEWNVQTGEVLFLHSRLSTGVLPTKREEWEKLIHPGDRARVLAEMQRTLESDRPFFEEYRVVLPDGTVRLRVGYGKVIRDSQGRPLRWIGVNKDVTDRRRTENALKESEQKLRTLVANVPVVLFALDRNGVFTHSDGKGLATLDLNPERVVGRPVWEVFGDRPDILQHVRRALNGDAHTATVRVGETAFETRYAPYLGVDGRVAGVIGVATDVTEQTGAEQALRASEARYRTLFERNLAGVFRSTLEGRILDCNESFARIFGYASPAEALAQPAHAFYLRPEDRTSFLARIVDRRSLTNYEMCARRRDGTKVWLLENATLLEGPDGRSTIIEGTVIDITERKRAEEQVQHMAFHDALTGLPNRLLFNDRLSVALAQAHRGRQKLAMLYLDLDRFKVINDSLGHTVGDELLRRVAERLRTCVREEDTVARLGGDEFVILVTRIASQKDAETVARKVVASIRLPFPVEGRDFFLTTSIGVSVYPSDGIEPDTLLQNADTAMYRAKEQGRDNFQLYAPSMNARAVERLSLENRLRQALQNDELVVHYQPIVSLRDGMVRGAEALLRWRHPERGLLQPAEFITLAEISGLIAPIGRWVLETACRQVREWQTMGHPGLTVSVNISPRQFQQADLVSQVSGALSASGIEAGCLDLEITESNAMQNAELAIHTLWELRRLGIGISMDDFGTGYSSLNYLKRFPIDRVKLDRSFVRDVAVNSEDAAIVRAVIAMAHTLKLIVAAEGVENPAQLAFLRQHRCDEMQGFLFSPPIAPEDFEELLRRRPALSATA